MLLCLSSDACDIKSIWNLSYMLIYQVFNLKENVRNFLKNCYLTSYFLCDNIWSDNFLFYQKNCFLELIFWEKREFYLFYFNSIFKDRVVFKETQSSIAIDVIVVKKHPFLNFVEKYARLKWKKEVNVIINLIV